MLGLHLLQRYVTAYNTRLRAAAGCSMPTVSPDTSPAQRNSRSRWLAAVAGRDALCAGVRMRTPGPETETGAGAAGGASRRSQLLNRCQGHVRESGFPAFAGGASGLLACRTSMPIDTAASTTADTAGRPCRPPPLNRSPGQNPSLASSVALLISTS
jgi:hypothetical protein